MKRLRPGALLMFLVIVAALAIAGCGGGDGSSESSSEGESTTASSEEGAGAESSGEPGGELSGEPIKIMALVSVTSPSGSSIVAPEIPPAEEATAEMLNEEGGVNGRPLEVVVCDDRGEPNQTEACARQAVEEEVVSIVGGLTISSDKIYPIVEKADISLLAVLPATASDFSNKLSFPFIAGTLSNPGIAQQAGRLKECKEPGLVALEGPSLEIAENTIGQTLEAEGKKLAYIIPTPPTVTDFSSQAREAAEQGDCVILWTTTDGAKAFVPAFRQVTDEPIIASPTSVSPELAEELPALEGTLTLSFFAPWGSPGSSEYQEAMEKYSDPGKYRLKYFYAQNAYLGVRVFADIASKLKTLDAKTFTEQLNKEKEVETYGLTPPLNLTPEAEFPAEGAERMLNPYVMESEIKDGGEVALSEEFTDLTAASEAGFGLK